MKKLWWILPVLLIVFASCSEKAPEEEVNPKKDVLSEVPEGAQAVSLRGKPLYASTPYENVQDQYEEAKKVYEADPGTAENIIWYGRRAAYTGDYRGAIHIFTEGIGKFPNDARFYRHRGHRYISIREFDRAIQDLEKAAALVEGKEDIVEPDGQPNAQNIPVSSLHTNIWYHLGLAYYAKNDLENALPAYRKGVAACQNDDMLVAFTHWLYMTLRLLGQDEEAEKALGPIRKDMAMIENGVYHRLCLFYKGEISYEELVGKDEAGMTRDAMAYGLGNWYFYNGQKEKAREVFEKILEGKVWASFGYLAAESHFVREFSY
jgi:tetratricopeptide (TPR) repeat protein